MTLITVVCYDFVIFNRLKSHTFENRLFPRAVILWKFRREKKLFVFFCSALFTFVLKLHYVKIIYPIFAGTNVLSSAKTRLPRILTETL